MNYFVVTKRSGNKEKQINFRVSEDIKNELEATAEFRGLSVSSWLHFMIVQANNAAKAEDATRFREISARQKLERQESEIEYFRTGKKTENVATNGKKETIQVLRETAGSGEKK